MRWILWSIEQALEQRSCKHTNKHSSKHPNTSANKHPRNTRGSPEQAPEQALEPGTRTSHDHPSKHSTKHAIITQARLKERSLTLSSRPQRWTKMPGTQKKLLSIKSKEREKKFDEKPRKIISAREKTTTISEKARNTKKIMSANENYDERGSNRRRK